MSKYFQQHNIVAKISVQNNEMSPKFKLLFCILDKLWPFPRGRFGYPQKAIKQKN